MNNLWIIISNPLDQFVVRPLFGNFNLGINTFTMDTILVAGVTFWLIYLVILANKNLSHLYTFAIGPALESLSYGAVVGSKRYRPLYIFVFVLIVMSNLMGMIPFSLTSTSFAIMTFFAGMTMFIGINIIALASYNWKFVNLFLPSGAPLAIAPFLIIIETISYFARVMSLSIRLFANLLAGHALMKIIGGFVWSTPLIAAALISGLRPIADTRLGLAENFQVFIAQISNLWALAKDEFASLLSAGDWWLHINDISVSVGYDATVRVILSYLATFLVVFAIVGSMLFVVGHYFHEDIAKPWTEHFADSKNSAWFKFVWIFYGLRAWISSVLNGVQATVFIVKRQSGVVGLALFSWAAAKHAITSLLALVLKHIRRPIVGSNKVPLNQVLGWNTYIAPVFTSAFWWIVIAFDLTMYFAHLVKFVAFTHQAGFTLSWIEVFTSKVVTFGPFGMGLIMAIVLSVLVVSDFFMACSRIVAPVASAKANKLFSGPACNFTDIIFAVIVGLFAGWLQVSIYYILFDIAFESTLVPESVIFAILARVSHLAPVYVLVFSLIAIIAVLVTERISDSINVNETRRYMKFIWYWGPMVIASAIIGFVLYWSVAYDIFFVSAMETYMTDVASTSVDDINLSDPFDAWTFWRWSGATQVAGYAALWKLVAAKLALNGMNPYATILDSMLAGLYVYLTFAVDTLATFSYYVVIELDSIFIAGVNAVIALAALILLPLITPLAWSFLLAITGLELVIAVLQAYVFVTLSSMYLNDIIKLH